VQNRSLSWNCYEAALAFVSPSPPKRRSAQGSSQKPTATSPRARRLQPNEGLDTAALAKAAQGSAIAAVNRDNGEGTAAC
jgi:hypothetical protein